MKDPTWSASYLAFVLPLTAEQVLQTANYHFGGVPPASRREWAWIQTAQRLVECWGFDGALSRLNGYGETARAAA